MIPPAVVPMIRRAILDFMNDIGGEQSDDVLTLLLNERGHRLARRDVVDELTWLAREKLISLDALGPFLVARILQDGRDVADGRLTLEGISKFKTGD